MQKTTKKNTPTHLSFATTATLMGVSLAIAIGMTTYTGSGSTLTKRHPAELRAPGSVSPRIASDTGKEKVSILRTQSPKDAYHDALERMLTHVSYDEWQAYIRTHPFIRDAIHAGDMAHAYATPPTDSFGLPVGHRWHGKV